MCELFQWFDSSSVVLSNAESYNEWTQWFSFVLVFVRWNNMFFSFVRNIYKGVTDIYLSLGSYRFILALKKVQTLVEFR